MESTQLVQPRDESTQNSGASQSVNSSISAANVPAGSCATGREAVKVVGSERKDHGSDDGEGGQRRRRNSGSRSDSGSGRGSRPSSVVASPANVTRIPKLDQPVKRAAFAGLGGEDPLAKSSGNKKSRRAKNHQEWCCQVCGNMNYGHRAKCHLHVCGAVKGFPGPYKTTPTGPKNKFNHQVARVKKLNWNCPRCGNENRSIRDQCHTKNCPIERVWSQNGEMSFREFKGVGPSSAAPAPQQVQQLSTTGHQPVMMAGGNVIQMPPSMNTSHSSNGVHVAMAPQPLGAMNSVSSYTPESSQSANPNLALNSISQLGMSSLGHPIAPPQHVDQTRISSTTNTSVLGGGTIPPQSQAPASTVTQNASGDQVYHLTAADLNRLASQCQQQAMVQLTQQQTSQLAGIPQHQQVMHHQMPHVQPVRSPQFQQGGMSVSGTHHGGYVDPLRLGTSQSSTIPGSLQASHSAGSSIPHGMAPSPQGIPHLHTWPSTLPQPTQLGVSIKSNSVNTSTGATLGAGSVNPFSKSPPDGSLFHIAVPPHLESLSNHPVVQGGSAQPVQLASGSGASQSAATTVPMSSSQARSSLSEKPSPSKPLGSAAPGQGSSFAKVPHVGSSQSLGVQAQPVVAPNTSNCADGSLFSIYPPRFANSVSGAPPSSNAHGGAPVGQ